MGVDTDDLEVSSAIVSHHHQRSAQAPVQKVLSFVVPPIQTAADARINAGLTLTLWLAIQSEVRLDIGNRFRPDFADTSNQNLGPNLRLLWLANCAIWC